MPRPTFKLRKTQDEYTLDKFEWQIEETKPPQKVLEIGGTASRYFKKTRSISKKLSPPKPASGDWASGKVLDGNSSGRFFRDY